MNNNTEDFTPKTDRVPGEEAPVPKDIPENTPGLFDDSAAKVDTAEAAPQSTKRASSKKLGRPLAVIGVAVVLMIALVVLLMFTVFRRTTPLEATINSLSAVFKDSKVGEVLKKLGSDGGMVEFSAEDNGAGISGSVIVNSKQNFLFDIDYTADGSTSPVNIQGYVGNDALAAMSEDFTDGEWYGFRLKDIKKQLEDSIFGPDSESEYKLDKETFDSVVEALESLRDSGEYNKSLRRAFDNIEKEWTVYLKDSVTVKDEKVRFRGKEIKVTKTTYTLDEYDLVELIKIVEDEYHKNEDFRNCIDGLSDTLSTGGNIFDSLSDSVKKTDIALTLEFYLKGSTLVQLDCEVALNNKHDTIAVEIIFGDKPSLQTGLDFSLIVAEGGYVQTDISASLRIEKDTESEYTVAMTIDYLGTKETGSARIALECDRDNGKFKFSAVVDGETELEINGKYKYESGKLLEIELDRMRRADDASIAGAVLKLKLKITLGRQSLSKPDYEDIFEMKDSELEDLIKKFGEATDKFGGSFRSDVYKAVPDDVTYGILAPVG